MSFEEELAVDFLSEYIEAQYNIENILSSWLHAIEHNEEEDKELIDNLFRSVHTIKGNLFMMELNSVGEIIHLLENFLSKIRERKITMVTGVDIFISGVIEQSRELSKQLIKGVNKESSIKKLSKAVFKISDSSNANFNKNLLTGIELLDTLNEFGHDYSLEKLIQFLKSKKKSQEIKKIRVKSFSDPMHDMEFFYNLIIQIESYFPFWSQRSDKILKLVDAMNKQVGSPIEPLQLEAAVYLHDIGMSFIAPQKIYTLKNLSESDFQAMQAHCEIGAKWLSAVSGWSDAVLMIRQHHEQYDGLGYPNKLHAEDICDGAKLLAIADTYVSIIKKSKKGKKKKPIIFAITEINKGSGVQFDPYWVDVFNSVMRLRLKDSKK